MNKKYLLFFIFNFSLFTFGFSQSWYPVGTGINGNYGILAEAVYNGELYAGGWFYSAGGVTANNIARWNGSLWDSVGSGLTGGINNVDVMCVYNGKLYVGGAFFAAEGLPATNIAVWDGSHWDTVGGGLTHCGGGAGWADAMAIYNGKLYVGGAFCHAGGIFAQNIACWDGSKWDSVSSGINDSVYSLAVYNGKLYAGGQFTRAGSATVSNMACWDGTSWQGVTTGANGPVLALGVYKTELFVGGEFTQAGGKTATNVALWNGTAWAAVGTGLSGTVGVEAFYVYNSLLYAGGDFDLAGSLKTNNIATWNGTKWDTVSTKGINNIVDAFAVLDSNFYAGGSFSRAGNMDAVDIAVWGGSILGVNSLANNSNQIQVYPNPNKGKFTIQLPIGGGQFSVTVYNLLGEEIHSHPPVGGAQVTIDLGAQPAGVYLYRIINNSGGLENQGKIIIE